MPWFNPSSLISKMGIGGKLARANLGGSRMAGKALGGLASYGNMSVMGQRAVLGGIAGGAYGAMSDNTSVLGGALMGASLAGPGIGAARMGSQMARIGLAGAKVARASGLGIGQQAARFGRELGGYSRRHFGKGWRQGYNFFSGF